jgi:hypothetical protein
VIDPKLADKVATPLGDLGGSKVCNHPDQMEELASYIAGEMNRNIKETLKKTFRFGEIPASHEPND